jgi:hypothetical protein
MIVDPEYGAKWPTVKPLEENQHRLRKLPALS